MNRSLVIAVLSLAACFQPVDVGTHDAGRDCTDGVAMSCNDSPADGGIGGVAGSCVAGTCVCNAGFEVNPATGRCRLASAALCTSSGDDQACNELPQMSSYAGQCVSGRCVCHSGFELASSGRCQPSSVTCTDGVAMSCNDGPVDGGIGGVAGSCVASTCVCIAGFEVNPATGRCRVQSMGTGGGSATGGGAATGGGSATGGGGGGSLPGETCANAQNIPVDVAWVSNLTGYRADHSGSTCASPAADRFYRFTLPVPTRVSLGVTSTSPSFFGSVALLDSRCNDLACAAARDAGTDFGVRQPNIESLRLAAGEYVVMINGTPAGSFTLRVALDATDGGATLCQAMESASHSLRNTLLQCSAPGDQAIYGFNRPGCDARAETQCTPVEEVALRRVAACERMIAWCANSADRARVTNAIDQCVSGLTVSPQCVAAMQ